MLTQISLFSFSFDNIEILESNIINIENARE